MKGNLKKRYRIIIISILLLVVVSFVLGDYYLKSKQHLEAVKLADQSITLIYQGDFEKAEENLKAALEIVDSENKIAKSRIYKNLAILHEYKDEIESAVDYYMKAQALFSETESEYYSFLGQINLFERDLNSAVNNFDKAIEIDPDNFDAHNNLGLLFMGQLILGVEPNYEMALPHNERAFELEKSVTTMQNLALNYYFVGEYDKALPIFFELDSILENDALAKMFIGLIYFNKKDFLPTDIYLSKAIELDPSLNSEDVQNILTEVKEVLSEMGIQQ